MKTPSNTRTSDSSPFKLGYVASHAYKLTCEITEIAELRRQDPSVRVYSFYRKKGAGIQHERLEEVRGDILTWSYTGVIAGLFYFLFKKPLGLIGSFLALMWASKSNPVYWLKNLAVFFF